MQKITLIPYGNDFSLIPLGKCPSSGELQTDEINSNFENFECKFFMKPVSVLVSVVHTLCGHWSTEVYQSKTIEPFQQYKGTIATSLGIKLNHPVWSLQKPLKGS